MTSFILLNILSRIITMKWEPSEYVLNTIVLIVVISFVFVRGRYALVVKDNKLRINNYPFSRAIECSRIKYLHISYKKIEIETTDNKNLVSNFVFGPESAIHETAVKAMTELKWSSKASTEKTLNDSVTKE